MSKTTTKTNKGKSTGKGHKSAGHAEKTKREKKALVRHYKAVMRGDIPSPGRYEPILVYPIELILEADKCNV